MSAADGARREGEIDAVVGALLESYHADSRAQFINRKFLPNRREIIGIIELLPRLFRSPRSD